MIRRACAVAILIASCALFAGAQSNVPIISGSADFATSTQGGATSLLPELIPVVDVPLGSRLSFESRGEVQEFYFRQNGTTGPYQHLFFWGIDYMQIDYVATPWLTIVAGRFLTPFNMYNERLTQPWIHNFQNLPFTYGFGDAPTGASTGLMARGVLVSRDDFQVNYTAYYSSLVDLSTHWGTGRTAGGRGGVFLPHQRLEFGFSYQRFLQDTHRNSEGAYFSWQPNSTPLDIKSEWAHSPSGQGYWLEGLYRLSKFRGPDSVLGRLAPVARVEQFKRNQFLAGDELPGTNVNEGDFGLNYYLPHEVRLNGSYGRQFTPQRDVNVWNFALTYRFLFPMWPGGSK